MLRNVNETDRELSEACSVQLRAHRSEKARSRTQVVTRGREVGLGQVSGMLLSGISESPARGMDKGMLDPGGTREGQTPALVAYSWNCAGPPSNAIGRCHHSHFTDEEVEAQRC